LTRPTDEVVLIAHSSTRAISIRQQYASLVRKCWLLRVQSQVLLWVELKCLCCTFGALLAKAQSIRAQSRHAFFATSIRKGLNVRVEFDHVFGGFTPRVSGIELHRRPPRATPTARYSTGLIWLTQTRLKSTILSSRAVVDLHVLQVC
jgi:hypothetical protein